MLDEAQIRVGHLLMEVGGLRFDATIPVALVVFLVAQLCAFVWLFSNLSANDQRTDHVRNGDRNRYGRFREPSIGR
jgi:hypothetical protein